MKAAAFLFVTLAATAQPAKVTQHMMLFEPTGTDLNVSETVIVDGGGKFQIAIPPDAELINTRGGKAAKAGKPGVYDVAVEGQPGSETRFDFTWTLSFVTPEELSGRILHGGGLVRLVFPKGVKVRGAMLESNGTEPTTLASIYTLKGSTFKITIDGAGTLHSQQAPQQQEEEQGPSIEQIQPRIYDRKYLILSLMLAILAIGFYLNFRASAKG